MTGDLVDQEDMKRMAGEKALEYVEKGMIVGLGTGSTVAYTIKKLGDLVKKGLQVTAVPTSNRTKKLAQECKIPLVDLDDHPEIDLTIDGADEVDSNLNAIKGGGGALTREKIVAYHSKQVIIVIDETKIVKALGTDFPLPVEVVKYGWPATKKSIEELGCKVELRRIVDEPYITDNGNYILDCEFERIGEPEEIDLALHAIPGVVETGLFIGIVDDVIVGSKQGIMSLGSTKVVANRDR
ncbi:MAG: ribose-5-phosphate isomerase RpiA [Methanobacteriota archaeon]